MPFDLQQSSHFRRQKNKSRWERVRFPHVPQRLQADCLSCGKYLSILKCNNMWRETYPDKFPCAEEIRVEQHPQLLLQSINKRRLQKGVSTYRPSWFRPCWQSGNNSLIAAVEQVVLVDAEKALMFLQMHKWFLCEPRPWWNVRQRRH